MVSKVQERIYCEAAAKLLGVDWTLFDIPEPPDFEVREDEQVFGLEVRQVFTEEDETIGSSSKRKESHNQRIITGLVDLYYSRGGPPVSAKFLGQLASAPPDTLVDEMLRTREPGAVNRVFEIDRLKVFLTFLPATAQPYRRWVHVSDRVGWARSVTSDELQRAVDRKADRLDLYLEKYRVIDLLLVADRIFNSGRLTATDGLGVRNPGFRAVYFLSYPESVVRVG
jgi:hypothetical protein